MSQDSGKKVPVSNAVALVLQTAYELPDIKAGDFMVPEIYLDIRTLLRALGYVPLETATGETGTFNTRIVSGEARLYSDKEIERLLRDEGQIYTRWVIGTKPSLLELGDDFHWWRMRSSVEAGVAILYDGWKTKVSSFTIKEEFIIS